MNRIFKSNKIIRLVVILAIITFLVSSLTTWINYYTSIKSLKSSLTDVAEDEKALIETLYNHSFSKDSILSILRNKNQTKQSIGTTGEIAIAQIENDSINFICRQDLNGNIKSIKIFTGAEFAQPIKSALKGSTGSLRGKDYNGDVVFAGYTYFEPFKWGIVAKIKESEVNKPFYYSLIVTIILGLVLVFFGSYLFIRITYPLLENITKSEENLSITLNSIGDAVISTDEIGLVIGMNPVAERLCGWNFDNAKSKPLTEVFNIINAETRLPVSNPVKKVIETGEIIGLANHTVLISRDGNEYQIADSASPIKNKEGNIKGVVLVFSDVTEEYALLEDLRRSEKRLRSTLDCMLEGCQIIGFDWRYLYINDAADIHNRRPKNELLGKIYMDIWPGIEKTNVFVYETICMNERRPQYLLNEFEYPDGTKRWFKLSIQPIPEGIFILSEDITEHKFAEDEVKRLNRIYSVLSNVNQAIVRIHEKEKLFEEICKIAVETGKFRMAWIGTYNAVLNKIEIKSYAGIIDGYLENLNIDLNNPLLRNGPSGQSFLSGKHIISNDILNDEIMIPWKESALNNGYRSSAAFPLKIFGNHIGIINIYSDEINYFNENEIRLLEEMSLDISFALEFIQHEIERKFSELKLENERIRLRTVIETIPDMIWLKDPNGVYLTCNPKFERFFGAKELEIKGKTDYDFLPKEFADFFRQKDKEAQISNKPQVNLEWVTFADDGHKELLETIKTPMYDSKGELIGILGISRDITEKQQTMEDLRLTTERLRVSLKNSNIVVAITNNDLRYEWIYNTHSEFPSDKVIGLRDDEISQNEGAFALIEMKKAILKTGKGMRKEIAFLNSNVEEIYDITGEPLFDSDGKIVGITTASLNITDRKKNELELIKARQKAEESDKLKSNFLANMSHELRTPMVGILGFSQLLVISDDIEEVNEMAELILNSGKRLMETLNLILDLSSIEAGESGIELLAFDIITEISNAVDIFKPLASKKNLKIEFNCDFDDLQIYSSRKAIESILNNLISNAIKFTNEGTISLSICTEIENSIEWVFIEVKDTGIGIEEKNYEQIFKEFRQVSEGLGRSHEGTGLGLTLTKKYTEILGGTISIKSKINEGTSFTIKLPVNAKNLNELISKNKIEDEKINNQIIATMKTNKKVLIVEDDMISNYLVTKYLKNICFIEHAVNAKEAIEFTKKIQFDAILMDINLGKSENGIFATKQIRSLDNYKHIPIIAMTAYAMKGDKEEFIAGGCSHYISKPFEKDEFLKLIFQVLEIK